MSTLRGALAERLRLARGQRQSTPSTPWHHPEAEYFSV